MSNITDIEHSLGGDITVEYSDKSVTTGKGLFLDGDIIKSLDNTKIFNTSNYISKDPITNLITNPTQRAAVGEAARGLAWNGNEIIVMGDSISRSQGVSQNLVSFWEYAGAASDGAMKIVANLGVNGAKTSDLIANQLPTALASYAGIVGLMEATNDALQGVSVQHHRTNIETMVNAIRAAGKVPLVVGAPPLNNYNVWKYNAAEQRLAAQMGFLYFNPWAVCCANGQWIDVTYSIDGVHPTPKAQRIAGAELWRQLASVFRGSPDLAWTNNDPDGMLTNCLNLTNASGVPTGWTGAAGVTHSCSEAGTGDVMGNWWKMTATNITAWQVSTRAGVALPANWQAGDVVRMSARMRTVGAEANGSKGDTSYPTQGKAGFYITMAWTGGSLGSITLRELDGDANGVFIADGVIPSGATGGNFQVVITQYSTASLECSIAQLQVVNLSLLARQ